ncbi:hypothetical protein LF887_11895 [Chryseobacterium sp. MEBOG06]|uniref:hypothetical protein n=1 Tax=Chryseobacterium sp. MEBOG06 TaxID=2879938 RepID=UPI001F3AD12C|nr:hypothetical protein [Chryseobacterium sp. MEBOG06]UKB86298.1 hypothetical protein LF887_11895 [Chryseobacterium sp. MEBOG06]
MKKISCIGILCIGTALFGQVGINTPNPKAILHIDGSKNNEATGNISLANQADDVVINSNGFIGIGTNNPTTSIEVKTKGTPTAPISGITIKDGSEFKDYVLTSDADGKGQWKPITLGLTRGVNGPGVNIPFVASSTFVYTGSYIDLGPGKWLVSVTQIVAPIGTNLTANDWMWIRSTFSDEAGIAIGDTGIRSNDVNTTPRYVSTQIQGPTSMSAGNSRYTMTNGNIYIENSSGTTKRYKYIVGNAVVAGTATAATSINAYGGSWSENLIYAIPTN